MVEFENTNLQNDYSYVVNYCSTYATMLKTKKIACHLKEKVWFLYHRVALIDLYPNLCPNRSTTNLISSSDVIHCIWEWHMDTDAEMWAKTRTEILYLSFKTSTQKRHVWFRIGHQLLNHMHIHYPVINHDSCTSKLVYILPSYPHTLNLIFEILIS